MKKFSFWALVILLALPLLQSCKEELQAEEENQTTDMSISARGGVASISKQFYTDRFGNKQEILNFATKEVYQATLSDLETKYNANSDNDNEYQPLLTFTSNLQFNSLLNDYISAENVWLMTDDLPDATDPDNNFYDLDEAELALLNKDRAVMIEGNILVYFQNGIVAITNGDLNIINLILEGNPSYISNDRFGLDGLLFGILVYIGLMGAANDQDDLDDACKIRETFREVDRIGNKKYKSLAKYNTQNGMSGSTAKIKLKMKAYKKRRWFGWKKINANMKIALDGQCGSTHCDLLDRTFNDNTDFYQDYTKKLKHNWTPYDKEDRQFYIQLNKMDAKFYVDNQLIRNIGLFDGNN